MLNNFSTIHLYLFIVLVLFFISNILFFIELEHFFRMLQDTQGVRDSSRFRKP